MTGRFDLLSRENSVLEFLVEDLDSCISSWVEVEGIDVKCNANGAQCNVAECEVNVR